MRACRDVCLGDLDLVADPMIVGQKILSCVVRLRSDSAPTHGKGPRRVEGPADSGERA